MGVRLTGSRGRTSVRRLASFVVLSGSVVSLLVPTSSDCSNVRLPIEVGRSERLLEMSSSVSGWLEEKAGSDSNTL